ncbi:hypothetical protein SSP24_06260 [Streptomyces spinoverrucosus]|uniref:Uncharacterized protein n=1 Tax=Streptomyces spinoverrucosus TaxID=284043 RepID=A0A4Y3VBP7_9ACTN|nr:hypothetical protein [Streptomyces spinoverrucosus]GEC02971.1 hypothetical protein SSP24_06260 [Streptomyces spinoverrucosus]GHB39190.1 hypothetical protein GCM10010397_06330 [Streptomyces spinoverrucosus]
MVDRPRLITPEIADTYGVSQHTVTKTWAQHPQWPDPVGKRGRYKEYDAQNIADFVRDHVERQAVQLEARRLYTAQDLEAAGIGIKAATIRADLTRGRWPKPDDTTSGVNRWTGLTVTKTLEGRRGYRRGHTD